MEQNPQALGWELKGKIRNILRSDLAMDMQFMMCFYNIMNLLPIYPLDGGQVVRELCLGVSPSRGVTAFSGPVVPASPARRRLFASSRCRAAELWYPPLASRCSAPSSSA